MSRPRFLHVGINHNSKQTIPDIHAALEGYFNGELQQGGDWYRYGAQNYVVWTDSPIQDLVNALNQLTALKGTYFLITEMMTAPEYCEGMMPRMFWEWLQRSRTSPG